MARTTAHFVGLNEELSRAKEQEKNDAIFPSALIVPDDPYEMSTSVAIWFYNVSPQEFRFSRLPNHREIFIPGCPPDKEYVMAPGAIQHPFREIHEDQNGNRIPVPTNGYREATRILNPMNPGVDQNWNIPDAFHEGGNLNLYGVFWSVYNPPEKSEIEAAKRRMEATYRKELEDMAAIESREGVDGARARANNVSRAAANYFGKSFSWHQTDLSARNPEREKVLCWACANEIFREAMICVHCGAPMDEAKRERWMELKFSEKKTQATA